MTSEADRITRMEGRLEAHEALCGERWERLREMLESSRQSREVSQTAMMAQQQALHAANDKRLGNIEVRMAWIAGAGAVALIAGQVISKLVFH